MIGDEVWKFRDDFLSGFTRREVSEDNADWNPSSLEPQFAARDFRVAHDVLLSPFCPFYVVENGFAISLGKNGPFQLHHWRSDGYRALRSAAERRLAKCASTFLWGMARRRWFSASRTLARNHAS